jgi:hypothetical protein
MKVKVTWQMSESKAREAAMRAGGDPNCESTVREIIRNSLFSQTYPLPASFARIGLQHEGYFIASIEEA